MKDKIKNVEIVEKAQKEFDDLVDNIKEHQSSETAQKFTTDFEDTINKLKKTPEMFPTSKTRKGARRALFSKYGVFLYTIIKKTTLRVITFYDSRMNR